MYICIIFIYINIYIHIYINICIYIYKERFRYREINKRQTLNPKPVAECAIRNGDGSVQARHVQDDGPLRWLRRHDVRNSAPLGPYRSTLHRALWWP